MSKLFALLMGMSFSVFAFDHNHVEWDQWLKKHVSIKGATSSVDYKTAKASPALLESYLKALQKVDSKSYAAFSESQRLAFLINAYNAFTVKLIVDNYPVKSIKDLGAVFSTPWKKKFFKFFGEETSLDNIEHDRIRKEFNEPRIHFAVVCASKGCPRLSNEAYRADKLETQFEAAATNFIRDSERNVYQLEKNELQLSKIFDWYGDDFKKKSGSVQNFIAPRLAKSPEEEAKMKNATLKFLDYDWSLNETPSLSKS